MREWNKEYEKNMQHSYMVLSQYEAAVTNPLDTDIATTMTLRKEIECMDYQERMVMENQLPGLLPLHKRWRNGNECYYYQIDSLESMEEVLEDQEIDYECLQMLMKGCMRLFQKLEEYLIDGSQVIFSPEYIFIDSNTKEVFFTFYPKHYEDLRQGFRQWMDNILAKLDHRREETVWLGYQIYRSTRNQNFVMEEIVQILQEALSQPAREPGDKTICLSQQEELEEMIMDREQEEDDEEDEEEKETIWRPRVWKEPQIPWSIIVSGILALGSSFLLAFSKLSLCNQSFNLSMEDSFYLLCVMVISFCVMMINLVIKIRQKKEIEGLQLRG